MRIELGAAVVTRDGQDVGSIDRLILEPTSQEIKAVVVRKGYILTRDVEIPMEDFEVDDQGRVHIAYTAEQIADLPEFVEGKYVTPPLEYGPRDGYPATGLYWPTTYGQPIPELPSETAEISEPVREEINAALTRQDLENAVIGEGSEIRSADGETIGQIHQLVFDPDSGHLTSLTLRRGFLMTEDTELPADLIASVGDGVVYLHLNASEAMTQLG